MRIKQNVLGHGLLAIIPAAYLAYLLAAHLINLPVCDQWAHVDMVQKVFDKTLSWSDLWQQQDDFRMPVQRLLVVALASVSHWNMALEVAANFIVVVTTFLLVIALLRQTETNSGISKKYWLLPILSVLVFSLIQYENWYWGFSLNLYLGNLGFIAVALLLSNPVFRWWRYWLAICAGLFATFSVHYGLMSWPLGFVLLAATHLGSLRRHYLPLGIWVFVSLAVILIYFNGLQFRGLEEPGAPKQIINYLSFILSFLASPLFSGQAAPAVALLGLLSFVALPVWLVISKRATIPAVSPFVAIGLYSIGGAIAAALGRVPLGSTGDALRYSTVSLWLWFSIIMLLYLVIGSGGKSKESNSAATPSWPGMTAMLALFFVVIDPLDLVVWRIPQAAFAWGLCALALLAYISLSVNKTKTINASLHQHLAIGALIAITVLSTNQSFNKGEKGAAWYQQRHFAPAIEQVVQSSKNGQLDESALLKLYCGIPVAIDDAKARIEVLKHHNLAAFAD